VFDKFKGADGSFNKDITNDTKGLLSLYNGAHLLIHGEVILEEAKAFAQHHLELMTGSLGFPLAEQVKRSLHAPLPRTCKRIETLHYISEYSQEEGHDTVLLELAKLDFNLLQHVHLKELKAITEWWNSFSGNVGLSFIRGRIVESYTWAYVVYHEKGFKLPRSIIAKMIVIITTLDDIYDTHATIEECRKLHGAIQRLDISGLYIYTYASHYQENGS
jgi:(-)-germacrene D synthase